MADDLPSKPQFTLPDDVNTLSQMRDQLSDYLNTLERNTDTVNAWLSKHQNGIIVGLHQFNRALGRKDEQAALDTLRRLGETAGFVLAAQDFQKLVEESFGKDSKLASEMAKIERGIPRKILEDLPEIKLPDSNAPANATTAAANVAATQVAAPLPDAEEKKGKKWWNPGTWFDKSEQEAAEAKQKSEAEAQRQIDEIKRHWRLVRSELIGLQSDRHYYVDSFMDWVGETLAPEKERPDAETQKLMEKYQNPQFVIDLAMQDYGQVMNVKADALRERALLYSKTAALIDDQRIAEFSAMLPALFPKHDTIETKQMKDLLLQDYGVASFADMALERVERKDEQLLLLKTALQLEPQLKLNGISAPHDIFERVLTRVLAPQDPLDSSALALVLDKFKAKEGAGAEIIGLANGKTVFERIAERFSNALPKMQTAMTHVLKSLGAPHAGAEAQLKEFVEATTARDPMKMASVLNSIASSNTSQAFKGLFTLAYPGISVAGAVTKAAKNTSDLSQLMLHAVNAGILDEFKVATNAAQGDAKNVLRFFNEQVLPDHADFSLLSARRLIATSFANGGLDQLRKELTRSGGWLEQVVSGDLNFEGRANWVAALLEPWKSDIVKANILAEASANAKSPEAKKSLAALDDNLGGKNVRLDDGRILTNLDRVANIWYDGESKVLRLTVNGVGQDMLNDLTPPMAAEVLKYIQRKVPAFQSEYDGLYNHKNIDRIVTKQGSTSIYWGNHAGVLNVPDETVAELHRNADFLHVHNPKNGQKHSINLKVVTLLQPLEDGTHLLVDKYGEVQVLEGNVMVHGQGALMDLSGTYFNPRNASVLSFDAAKNRVEFRSESNDFDDLLESAAQGQFFYGVDLSKADFERVKKAVAEAPAITAPGSNNLGNLYFNFENLGYLKYNPDSREPGFETRRHGVSRKPGFIPVEQADLAANIHAGLAANPDLVHVGGVVTHKSMIDDAYYSTEKGLFYLVMSNDLLSFNASEGEAYDTLKKLSREDGFTVVGATMIANPKGVGTVELPADIINLNRIVMQFHSEAQDKTFLISDNDRFFHIGYNRQQAESLFDMLEAKGLDAARAATPKALQWTQSLRDVAAALPQQNIKVTPSLTDLSRPYLLEQVTGKPGENRSMPAPKADFSVAAAPLKPGAKFDYPERTRSSARKVSGPKPGY